MTTTKRTILYVMSPSYSGSTLITRILAEHSKIATVGELKATGISDIQTYQCSCGERFLTCPFWLSLVEVLKKDGVTLKLEDLKTRIESESELVNRFLKPNLRGSILEAIRSLAFKLVPGAQQDLQNMLKRQEKIIERICEIQDGSVFVDESKDPLRAMYFFNSGLWDFRVVHLVRDGRGTVNSDLRHKNRPLAVACQEWNDKIDEMNRFAEMCTASILKVRYEDMCMNPDAVFDEILAFAGLESEGDLQQKSSIQHIMGNDMRLKPMREISLDEKWRSDLSEQQLREFEALSGERNRALGYQ